MNIYNDLKLITKFKFYFHLIYIFSCALFSFSFSSFTEFVELYLGLLGVPDGNTLSCIMGGVWVSLSFFSSNLLSSLSPLIVSAGLLSSCVFVCCYAVNRSRNELISCMCVSVLVLSVLFLLVMLLLLVMVLSVLLLFAIML